MWPEATGSVHGDAMITPRARLRVWFNHASSSAHVVIRQLRHRNREQNFVLLSHASEDFGAQVDCDLFAREPRDLDASQYVAWCLEFCAKNRVDVFVPSRRRDAISDSRKAFEGAGTRLVVAGDGPTLRLLEDKAMFVRRLPPGVPAPWTRVVTNAEGFREAVAELRSMGRTACFKPARSTFGLGFYRIDDSISPLKRLLSSEPARISASEAVDILATAECFPELLVMEYLSGPEFSVDVAAHEGKLLALVVRRKPFSGRVRVEQESTTRFVSGGRSQVIERHPRVEQMVDVIVSHFSLGGLCNVQFRTAATIPERPKILEVNGRMSGGLGYAALAGVDLLSIAIDAAWNPRTKGSYRTRPPARVRVQERSEFFAVDGAQSHARNQPETWA
jgi:hypothetical protein